MGVPAGSTHSRQRHFEPAATLCEHTGRPRSAASLRENPFAYRRIMGSYTTFPYRTEFPRGLSIENTPPWEEEGRPRIVLHATMRGEVFT